jgi:hypothetical protein
LEIAKEEVSALRSAVATAKEALEPFVDSFGRFEKRAKEQDEETMLHGLTDTARFEIWVTGSICKRARSPRAALAAAEKGEAV